MKQLIALVLILSTGLLRAQTDEQKVKDGLTSYKNALERLDVSGTETLFTANSKIIESGSDEGTYAHYLEHHIGPELSDFKSFKFENYKIQVTVMGANAIAVEAYDFIIVLKDKGNEIKRKGVASSFLVKEKGAWKIMHMHTSSQKP